MGRLFALGMACLWALIASMAASPAVATGHDKARQLLSSDGRYLLLVQAEPPCLVVLDAARAEMVQVIAPASRDGRIARGIAAMRVAPIRKSFIVAPADLPELWEISFDPRAEEIYDGMVHDFRFGEGVPRPGFLGLRRTLLPAPLADFVLDRIEAEAWALAASSSPARTGAGGFDADQGLVINLDVRRSIATPPASEVRARIAAAPPPAAQDEQVRTTSRSWPCPPPKVRTP